MHERVFLEVAKRTTTEECSLKWDGNLHVKTLRDQLQKQRSNRLRTINKFVLQFTVEGNPPTPMVDDGA